MSRKVLIRVHRLLKLNRRKLLLKVDNFFYRLLMFKYDPMM